MALPQEKLYTLADILEWPEDERTELICGVPTMLAAPARIHQEIITALVGQLYQFLRGKKCKVYAAPLAVRLFERKGDAPWEVDTVVEPDISVICDPEKLDDTGCIGAPDFIIEVLSPSTQRHDRFTKFKLYQQAGVREYWMIDPASKSVQTFVLEDGRYTAMDFGVAGDKLRVSVLEGCVLDLSEIFPNS